MLAELNAILTYHPLTPDRWNDIEGLFGAKGGCAGLLKAEVEFAAGKGAKIIEGYPIETKTDSYPPVYAWTGFKGAFKKAGFREVERRSPTRSIMRIDV